MASELARLFSALAVQAALDEFSELGRSVFLERYGYGKSRDFLVRNPTNGQLCDSKAIVGVAYGFQYPDAGPLKPADFSGGEATVVAKLQSLGFQVVQTGHDWSQSEVDATVAAYFDMLMAEAKQEKYNKSERNAVLRTALQDRTKASVELKHQNISAVLHEMDLPFIDGYKPRGNIQLLLRKTVARYIADHPGLLGQTIDAMEEVKMPASRTFHAVVVSAPTIEPVSSIPGAADRMRLPRKTDFAVRDESNRKLGRAGEQWVLAYEQHRLQQIGLGPLFQRVDWVSDRLGDGTGYDILSFESDDAPRYIEVKTTNGAHKSSFIISRNELDFSRETGEAFQLYRVFQFRTGPRVYMLQGDVSRHLQLEPIDFRASFRKLIA